MAISRFSSCSTCGLGAFGYETGMESSYWDPNTEQMVYSTTLPSTPEKSWYEDVNWGKVTSTGLNVLDRLVDKFVKPQETPAPTWTPAQVSTQPFPPPQSPSSGMSPMLLIGGAALLGLIAVVALKK